MNISEELIKEIVAKVCENLDTENKMPFERKMLSNGMFTVKTDTVKCGPFPFDIGDAQDGTSLLDVAPSKRLRESASALWKWIIANSVDPELR
jgi:hypothetical protein